MERLALCIVDGHGEAKAATPKGVFSSGKVMRGSTRNSESESPPSIRTWVTPVHKPLKSPADRGSVRAWLGRRPSGEVKKGASRPCQQLSWAPGGNTCSFSTVFACVRVLVVYRNACLCSVWQSWPMVEDQPRWGGKESPPERSHRPLKG